MEKNKKPKKADVYLTEDLVAKCDLAAAMSGTKSRSEFIRDATNIISLS